MLQVDLGRYRWIAQGRDDYCILAAIENALAYLTITTWPQERIYEEWGTWYAQNAGPDWNGIPRFDLQSPSLFLPKTELGEVCGFLFYDGRSGPERAVSEIVEGLSEPEPVPAITSVNLWDPARGRYIAHMYVVLGIAEHVVLYHDPDPRSVGPRHIQLSLLISLLGRKPHVLRASCPRLTRLEQRSFPQVTFGAPLFRTRW